MELITKQYIDLKCLEVTQPIGKFYIGVMDHADLEFISYADIRRLEEKNEEREVEIYSGIQRPLAESRVKEIGRYVNLSDATFPTSIILHIEEKHVSFDHESLTMHIQRKDNVAKVLDGQHRIAGLSHFTRDSKEFQLNVTIYVGMELEDQAIVFSTINQTQTKVNHSLASDLFAFAKSRSPQKTAHNIVRALNEKKSSPFYNKIKILGTAEDPLKETITQATFVESIIKYITSDKAKDRDLYRQGKKPEKAYDKELKNRFLRNLFVDEKDGDIALIIWNYFSSVQEKWPEAWNPVTPQMILNRSTGFIALMNFLKDAYLSFNKIGEVISKEEFDKIFVKVPLKSEDFIRINFIPGSGGQSKLYKDLKEYTGL